MNCWTVVLYGHNIYSVIYDSESFQFQFLRLYGDISFCLEISSESCFVLIYCAEIYNRGESLLNYFPNRLQCYCGWPPMQLHSNHTGHLPCRGEPLTISWINESDLLMLQLSSPQAAMKFVDFIPIACNQLIKFRQIYATSETFSLWILTKLYNFMAVA